MEGKAMFERRREVALAQLDAVIDVLSAWRGRYEDDDRHANIGWICNLIPQCDDPNYPDRIVGWLPVGDTTTPGLGWQIRGDTFSVSSLCGSFKGMLFDDLTRRHVREAARRSGVSLPSRHATLYLSEKTLAQWLDELDGVAK